MIGSYQVTKEVGKQKVTEDKAEGKGCWATDHSASLLWYFKEKLIEWGAEKCIRKARGMINIQCHQTFGFKIIPLKKKVTPLSTPQRSRNRNCHYLWYHTHIHKIGSRQWNIKPFAANTHYPGAHFSTCIPGKPSIFQNEHQGISFIEP